MFAVCLFSPCSFVSNLFPSKFSFMGSIKQYQVTPPNFTLRPATAVKSSTPKVAYGTVNHTPEPEASPILSRPISFHQPQPQHPILQQRNSARNSQRNASTSSGTPSPQTPNRQLETSFGEMSGPGRRVSNVTYSNPDPVFEPPRANHSSFPLQAQQRPQQYDTSRSDQYRSQPQRIPQQQQQQQMKPDQQQFAVGSPLGDASNTVQRIRNSSPAAVAQRQSPKQPLFDNNVINSGSKVFLMPYSPLNPYFSVRSIIFA